MAPRVLYGLDEVLVLFPYERGSRRSRLVMRCRALHRFCRHTVQEKPVLLGAALIVGEVLSPRWGEAFAPSFITGTLLKDFVAGGCTWALRHYRAAYFAGAAVRFEAGSKTIFATVTGLYDLQTLQRYTLEGLTNAARTRARLS